MPSLMAIVSKAVFEKSARGKGIGDLWETDRYVSQHKALAALDGGDLYLVTVRPPDEALWLVAVLSQPTFDGTQWIAGANTRGIRDISALKSQLRFANGQGLPAKAGTLGMSLQTPRVLAAGDVALLAGAATQPSAPTPTSTKAPKPPKAKAAVPPPAVTGDDDAIVRAIAQLRAHEPAAALASLLDAWEATPHPRLAELIATLSASVRTPTPANIRGKTAAARAAWEALAARATALDLPVLLESLCDVTSGDAGARLAVVERAMPDPRVDAALVDILTVVPFRATSTMPFWTKLFALLAKLQDARQLPRLQALTFEDIAVTMREKLREKRDKLVAKLAFPAVDEPAQLGELASLIGVQRAAGAADLAEVQHLLDSVHATPDDDGPRLVLADALIERGDPRGELISVQIKLAHDPDDRALRAREKELLDAHGRGWLGELSPIVMADFRFERGFLAACRVDNEKVDRVRALVGHPAWSTVHTFAGSALIALDPVMRSLRTLEFDQYNARRHEQLPDAWRELLAGTPRAIEELRYANLHSEQQWLDTVEGRRRVQISDHDEVAALCTCSALPKLKRLVVVDQPIKYIGRLATAPVLDRLERIGFVYARNDRFDVQRESPLVDFRAVLELARVPTVAFLIGSFHETELVLERGATGYERGTLLIGPTMSSNWSHPLVDEAIRMLDTVPRTLRQLRIRTRRHTETQQVARLRAAATQLNIDCDVETA